MFVEEFKAGQTFRLKPVSLTSEDIKTFAMKYDPQPIHIDEEFAREGLFRGIIASGVHTLSVIWSEWIKTNRFGTEIIGGKGLDFVQWSAPVRPGDILDTTVTVVEATPFDKKQRGLLVLRFDAVNQHGTNVLSTQARAYLKSRL
ncbi:MaoC/PaaZ C-terminal domain-containing protein [Alicyclobacillus sp. SO9]|uniref:MaoC/PaaZ C-terminal domain-containing protein n=1 Tax=Alicyclobacillus sp. SO9 TaxID=2665646 RepID=UPI0018E788DB|nr:MaoC/PaaZ C-terminal domain-containing protein [Alicyclobacillus sp. SO9]QQE77181.1 hypothetical protein GI364_14525 [Alicyclobacillus sp. SO9]